MIVLDTSFLYAFFQKEDKHHKKAREIAKIIANEELIFIPIEVVEELLTIVTYRESSATAIKIANILLDPKSAIGIVNTHEIVFDEAWAIFKKLNPHKFSFVDCVLISMTINSDGAKLVTFDKALAEIVATY